MAKRKKKRARAKKTKPIHMPLEMRERLNTIVAVIQTVADALAGDEERAAMAHTLVDCALYPLIEIRDKLEKAR